MQFYYYNKWSLGWFFFFRLNSCNNKISTWMKINFLVHSHYTLLLTMRLHLYWTGKAEFPKACTALTEGRWLSVQAFSWWINIQDNRRNANVCTRTTITVATLGWLETERNFAHIVIKWFLFSLLEKHNNRNTAWHTSEAHIVHIYTVQIKQS